MAHFSLELNQASLQLPFHLGFSAFVGGYPSFVGLADPGMSVFENPLSVFKTRVGRTPPSARDPLIALLPCSFTAAPPPCGPSAPTLPTARSPIPQSGTEPWETRPR